MPAAASRQGQAEQGGSGLVGTWERVGSPDTIIEFQSDGAWRSLESGTGSVGNYMLSHLGGVQGMSWFMAPSDAGLWRPYEVSQDTLSLWANSPIGERSGPIERYKRRGPFGPWPEIEVPRPPGPGDVPGQPLADP